MVVQNRADREASSYRTQIYELKERIKTLEAENSRLKREVDEANRKYEDCASRLPEKSAP